jgi:hypothetical protein
MAVVVPIISTFDSKGIDKAVRDFRELKKAGERGAFAMLNTNKAVNSIGKTMLKFGAITGGVAGVIGGSFVKAAYESQKVMKQTEAIIKATGGAAGLTATQIGKLSTQLSLQTGVDDELIQSSMNLLLTFKKVQNQAGAGNDIFSQASKLMLDLGNVFGGTDKAAIQLGKALSNPISGITALRRSGIDFTDQQRAQIKTLVESGRTLEAQKVILKEIESQVGGTAAAGATGFDRMRVAVGNMQEELGNVLIPFVERFANAISANVLPVVSRFTDLIGSEGLGSAINYLTGSIINGIASMGIFGKVIMVVAGAFTALKVAVVTFTAVQGALRVATILTTGALNAQIVALNATKVALMAAGGVTALLTVAATLYAVYASQKSKAVERTNQFTDALLLEGTAQSDAFKELTKNNTQFRIMVASLGDVGLSMNDVNEYINSGTGKFKLYVDALDKIPASADTSIKRLDAFANIVGISATAFSSAGGSIAFGLEQFANIAKGARGESVDTANALALLKNAGFDTGNTLGGAGGKVETAAEKFKKFADAAQSVATNSRSVRDAVKSVADAQDTLTAATDNVKSALDNFNKVTKGYGASSREAAEAQKDLARAQRDATRAGLGLADAQQAVLDAQRKIADLTKAADPRTVQEAQDDLTEAQFRQIDAQEALDAARREGTQREITEAEIDLREAINGVTDANTKLAESQRLADPALLAQAQRDLTAAQLGVIEAEVAQKEATDNVATAQQTLNEKISGATAGSVAYTEALKTLNEAQKTEVGAIDGLRTAKEREIETTKALVKANLLLQKSRKKLTKKQIKEAEKLVDKLQTPVSVPSPTSLPSIPSFDFGNFDFSGLDLSGIDFSGIGGLAKGGIVTKPTLTWVGEGGESEAVIPLSKMGDMGGGDVYNITINSKIADATLPDVLVAELRKFNRRSGAINIQVA